MGKRCKSHAALDVFAKTLLLSKAHDGDADLYEETVKDAAAGCLANTTIVLKSGTEVAVALNLRLYMEEERKRVNKEGKKWSFRVYGRLPEYEKRKILSRAREDGLDIDGAE